MVRALKLLALCLLAACAGRGKLAVDPLAPERALFAQREFARCAAALTPERLAGLPRRARADGRALLARSLDSDGRFDDALAAYQYGATLHPKNLELVSGLAWVLHRLGLDDRARPLFERVLAIHPNNASGNLGLAEIQRSQGDLASAEAHYETALTEAGWRENPTVQRDYAELLADRQRFDAAARAVEKSLSLARTPEAYITAARIERRRLRVGDAYARLGEALALDPGREEAHQQRALWLLEDSRLPEAAAEAEVLLAKAPGAALARWVRGVARARQGDLAGARADLAAAAASRRENPFVASAALALLKELHDAAP
ncbi:MAG: tetratricopeptide repeat protein [Elusimicrobia bacterium]|nr:tetratricopeptide repeat protein [Elusimicrobiota bacterium]